MEWGGRDFGCPVAYLPAIAQVLAASLLVVSFLGAIVEESTVLISSLICTLHLKVFTTLVLGK